MRFYTAVICTDGLKKWALIEERPPSENRHWNEYARHRFTRKGLTVTAIITDRSITEQNARELLIAAFDNRAAWWHVDLGAR